MAALTPEDRPMPGREKKPTEKVAWKLGDRVRLGNTGWTGPIVEFRGPLAPGGVQVYRIELAPEPDPQYIEVREDQMIYIPPEPQPPSD